VRCGSGGDVAGTKRECGHVGTSFAERGQNISSVDVEHGGVVKLSVHHDSLDTHFVLEGLLVQLEEKRSLTGRDFVTFLDNLEVFDDFNFGSANLGGDVQLLEETSLLRVKSSRTSFDHDILGGDGTNFGGCFSHLTVENFL